jgi:hypothetical protein
MADITSPFFEEDLSIPASFYSGSLYPAQSQSFDLGSGSLTWNNLYVTNISASGTIIAGSISASVSNAVSASYALSASNAQTASFTVSASFATKAVTASLLQNTFTTRNTKFVNVNTSSYTTGLIVNLTDNASAYVRCVIAGNWSGSGGIGYTSEFFIQKGTVSQSFNQPGLIVSEINNNNKNKISSKIVDPGLVSGSANFLIQFIAKVGTAGNITNAPLIYDVMGNYISVS